MGVVSAVNSIYVFNTSSPNVVNINLLASQPILSTSWINNNGHLQLYILTATKVAPVFCPLMILLICYDYDYYYYLYIIILLKKKSESARFLCSTLHARRKNTVPCVPIAQLGAWASAVVLSVQFF